jgi:hypothetical protein
MPGFLYHVGAATMCPHGGQGTHITTNTRVLVSGQPVGTLADTTTIAGCPFVLPPAGTPHPCLTVQWLTPAARVRVNGQPALLQTSTALCLAADMVPQGPPVITGQTRVQGT